MKRGLTLIELQYSLLLMLLLMASLFLFTAYFWRNHYHYSEILRFQAEAETFSHWLDQQLINARAVSQEDDKVTFLLLDGVRSTLTLRENGPFHEELPFFSVPVKTDWALKSRQTNLSLSAAIHYGDRTKRFERTRSLPSWVGFNKLLGDNRKKSRPGQNP